MIQHYDLVISATTLFTCIQLRAVPPNVIVSVRVFPGFTSYEPVVLIAGVVGHKVHYDFQPPVPRLDYKCLKVSHGAKYGINVSVVRDVVAKVSHGRPVDWRQPQGLDTNINQMVQSGGDPPQVPGSVIIGVLEGAWVDLVDDTPLPPLGNKVSILSSQNVTFLFISIITRKLK